MGRLVTWSIPIVLTLAGFAGANMHAQSQTGAPEVVKVTDAYRNASLARDANAVAALYTDDAVEMPPFEPPIKGKVAIQQYYTNQFGGPAKLTDLSFTHVESKVSGEVGYDVGTFRQTITDGQHPMNDEGKYVVILKRVGGAWKVAYAIYSSDKPPNPTAGNGQ